MPGRGPQTFKKRQKEQERRERQQEKMAKRLAKKSKGPSSPSGDQEEIDTVSPLGGEHDTQESTVSDR